ncbi:MAG: hypothetical protein GWO02_12555 [Gammaproteobacteria bacterium]|nr:hypothetical protein [Gammaproteobacteria bacterium]
MRRQFGPRIGSHLGKPIYESIKDERGGYYVFDRVAWCDNEGACPLYQLRRNEILLDPGLIYRRVPD